MSVFERFAKKYFEESLRDLERAGRALDQRDYPQAVFYAQQSVEEDVKSTLEVKRRAVYDHGPELIGIFVEVFEDEWRPESDRIIEGLEYLTEYYKRARYPFLIRGGAGPRGRSDRGDRARGSRWRRGQWRWCGIISREGALSEVRRIVEERGKRLRALLVFGSSVSRPWSASDIDLLVIVDHLSGVREKMELEAEVAGALRGLVECKPVDVIAFDEQSFTENLEPGCIASGLIAGYEALYDELGVDELISTAAEKAASMDIVIERRGRRINLSAPARAKLRRSKT